MLLKAIFAVFLAVGIAQCQTPPGFEPSTSHKLGVKFGKKAAAHQGNKLDKSDTNHAPHLKVKSLKDDVEFPHLMQQTMSNSRYIVFMIDLDVPRNDTKVPFLHWYQPGLKVDRKTGKLHIPNSNHLDQAEYYPPSPPPGPEHRYVELLFDQPQHYTMPSEFKKYLDKKPSTRVGFDIGEFVKAADLKRPIAGNWFLVQETDEEDDEL